MDRHDTLHDTPATASPADAAEPRRLGRRAFFIATLVALLLVGGVGWLAWKLTQNSSTGTPAAGAPGGQPRGGAAPGGPGGPRGLPPTTVGLATVARADIPVTVEALGTVVPAATVRVKPQVSGVLREVRYREGQMVRAGDLLALIDPRPFEMTLQQATGQRMQGEAQLEAARVTLQRYRTLLQQDSIARQEVDSQEALVKQLEAGLVVSRANEGTARLNLGYTRITAPIAGRVGLRTVDVGNVVTQSDTNGVAVITQMAPIDVEFSVPQDLVGALRQAVEAGTSAKALDRSRSNVLATGKFSAFDNLVDTQTGTVKAKARFENGDGALFPNQFVNVQLQLRTIEDALVVPVAAVRAGPTGDQVFVVQPDRTVRVREVQRGQVTGERVQIVRGLAEGDRVVTEGADRLRDGARVTLPGDAGNPAARPGGASGGGERGVGGEGTRRRSQPQGTGGGAPAP